MVVAVVEKEAVKKNFEYTQPTSGECEVTKKLPHPQNGFDSGAVSPKTKP